MKKDSNTKHDQPMPRPIKRIGFMGTAFTASEMRKISKLWALTPINRYPKTRKKFSAILRMALSIAESLECGDIDNINKKGGKDNGSSTNS